MIKHIRSLLAVIPIQFKIAFGVIMLLKVAFVVLIVGIALFFFSCITFKNIPHDSILEEIVEEVIKKQTGLDIDLTPSSLEK